MKHILVITGSPRPDGNSALLAQAFIEGAKAAGNEITLVEARKLKINACIACRTCFTTGTACSFDDDFNALVPMMEKADIIVFCTPLYWFTFPAPLKAVIDKLYAFTVGRKNLRGKESILLVCAGLKDMKVFEGLMLSYDMMLNYLKWQKREIFTVLNVDKIGDIKNTGSLIKAKNIGLNIF